MISIPKLLSHFGSSNNNNQTFKQFKGKFSTGIFVSLERIEGYGLAVYLPKVNADPKQQKYLSLGIGPRITLLSYSTMP